MCACRGTALGISLHCGHFVPKKPCCFTPCVGNERFRLGKFELEFFPQECSKVLFDFFGFILRANKAQQEIVRIPYEPESAKVLVVGVSRWEVLCLFSQSFSLRSLSFPTSDG